MQNIFALRGYYVAAYTQPVGVGRYVGFAKICIDRPVDATTAEALERLASVGTYVEEVRALRAAEFQARQVVESLEPNWAPFTTPGAASRF